MRGSLLDVPSSPSLQAIARGDIACLPNLLLRIIFSFFLFSPQLLLITTDWPSSHTWARYIQTNPPTRELPFSSLGIQGERGDQPQWLRTCLYLDGGIYLRTTAHFGVTFGHGIQRGSAEGKIGVKKKKNRKKKSRSSTCIVMPCHSHVVSWADEAAPFLCQSFIIV